MIREYHGMYIGPIEAMQRETALLHIDHPQADAKSVTAQFDQIGLTLNGVRLSEYWHKFDRRDFQLITWCIKCEKRNVDPHSKYCGDGSDKDNGHCFELVTYGAIRGDEGMEVCVPKFWTDKQIITVASKREQKGEWKIDKKEPCNCQDMKERVHVTLK